MEVKSPLTDVHGFTVYNQLVTMMLTALCNPHQRPCLKPLPQPLPALRPILSLSPSGLQRTLLPAEDGLGQNIPFSAWASGVLGAVFKASPAVGCFGTFCGQIIFHCGETILCLFVDKNLSFYLWLL